MAKPNWEEDIKDDVIEECTKYGGIVHIHIDKHSPEGNIYIKCPSISIAISALTSMNGRYFAGKCLI
jgi:RNA-binding protein 39